MTDDEVRAAKSPRQRHREACAALDAAVAANDTDAMREALREIKAAETDDQPYADPLAAAVAAKCGVRAGPPPDKPDTRTTREIAAAAMRTTIADRQAPDESDTRAAALDDGYAALNTAIALNDGEAMKKALLQIEEADQPDQPDDPLAAAVTARVRRKDNKDRAHFGLLPNQEEE